jgi:hypothetical protein
VLVASALFDEQMRNLMRGNTDGGSHHADVHFDTSARLVIPVLRLDCERSCLLIRKRQLCQSL